MIVELIKKNVKQQAKNLRTNGNNAKLKLFKIDANKNGDAIFVPQMLMPNGNHIGNFSPDLIATKLMFREINTGVDINQNTATRPHYIVYLSGETKVSLNSGEYRLFVAGEVLLIDLLNIGKYSVSTKDTASSIVIDL